MHFEDSTYSTGQEKPKTPEKKRPFEMLTNFLGYEVTISVENGPDKISASVDMVTKKADIAITPEGIKAAYDFLKESGAKEAIDEFFKGSSDVLRERMLRYLNKEKKG